MSDAAPPRSAWIVGAATCVIVASSTFMASAARSMAGPACLVLVCMFASVGLAWRKFHRSRLHWSVCSMLDDIDRGLIHALHIDARASFSRIGEVLGVSTQTV